MWLIYIILSLKLGVLVSSPVSTYHDVDESTPWVGHPLRGLGDGEVHGDLWGTREGVLVPQGVVVAADLDLGLKGDTD